MRRSRRSRRSYDHIKKAVYHGHNLNEDEVEKELGDVIWCLVTLAETQHFDLNEIAEKRFHKLMKRLYFINSTK
ncbi:MazG nucleotide pyrophosphohydrolase domain-containing protein [Bacillus sp. TH13]|uniref:MazG nucleotide pyrophosphohydrolase domain-containing protein n=1 Tax=Bacillus sp. TH13 TaxID=2796379 RepID=UPI001F5B8D65|nr:MazG nucleotide pyrophosphohydrolase domain-containing protein [Bacillus sp. TH13]